MRAEVRHNGQLYEVHFVCNGNHDRSTAAQATGNQYIGENGLEELMTCTSSGLFVTRKEKPRYDWLAKVLRRGINRKDLFSEEEKEFIMKEMTFRDYDKALALFKKAAPYFVKEAVSYREILKPRLGLKSPLKTEPTQFEPRNDMLAILCMTNDQRGRILEEYRIFEIEPPEIVGVLPQFAGRMNLEVDLHLGDDFNSYYQAIGTIRMCVPAAMEIIHKHILLKEGKKCPSQRCGWDID